MPIELSPEESKRELDRRFAEACKRVTPEAIANGHAHQLAVLTCVYLNLLLMCSRRAGKTRALCGLILLTMIRNPGCSCLYLALTAGQAEKVWRRMWLPMIRKFKIPVSRHEDSTMQMTFPSGSVVVFSGTNNLRTVTHLLGDSMAGGIAVLDEQQSDPGVLEDAVKNIIGPMINETTTEMPAPGRMVIAGTVPDDPIGYFWELWLENFDEEKGGQKPNTEWQCFAWSRFENPHEKDNQWHMENYCKKFKLAEDDPIVLRNWKGIRTWDTQNKCFGYRHEVNRWEGKPIEIICDLGPFDVISVRPPHGIDRFWVGIHPSEHNARFVLELFGTSSESDAGAWHLSEAVTDLESDPFESQWIGVIKAWKEEYSKYGRFVRFIGHPTSNKETNELLLRTHGIPIESAMKGTGSLRGRVEHVRNLNMSGSLHVISGSILEIDFIKSAWNKAAHKKGKWEYDPKWKPGAGEAATYVLSEWTAQREKKDGKKWASEEEKDVYEAQQSFIKRYRDSIKQAKQAKKKQKPHLWGPQNKLKIRQDRASVMAWTPVPSKPF